MGKARIKPGLAARLAAGPVRRKVDRVTDAAAAETRDRAPDGKTWVTHPSEHPRHWHAEMTGTTIPENVSYKVPKVAYIRKGRDDRGKAINPAGGWKTVSGYDLASRPRDPRLPDHQSRNCGCQSMPVPGALARATRTTSTVVTPVRVSAKVVCSYDRVVEAEFGSSHDPGLHFMGTAARVVAARYLR
ncbi:hypothetical protein ABT352_33475 [Streptosporangium sp. NPDC000563]|uniref:hypothetical protein n=1 Tax=Streptosporangium sp. NPDC000563 TaxID=3154366 RepID=UPI003320ACE2